MSQMCKLCPQKQLFTELQTVSGVYWKAMFNSKEVFQINVSIIQCRWKRSRLGLDRQAGSISV